MKKKLVYLIGAAAGLAFIFYIAKPIYIGNNVATKEALQSHGQSHEQDAQSHKHSADETAPSGDLQETPAETPTVEIPMDKQQLIAMKTTVAEVRPFARTIRTVGLVEYDQRRLNTINAKVEGWVEKLYVNFTGAFVKKGDPVADIYSPELWATQQEFINLLKWVKQTNTGNSERNQAAVREKSDLNIGSMINKDAKVLVEAARQRLRLFDISDEQIGKIEESEKPIRTLTVYSPYSGYVLQKNVNQGMRVMAGQGLLDVIDLSTVWITADIYEFELPLIKVGDVATVQLSYLAGKRFSTKIDYIYPTLEGETRTAKARFVLPNGGGYLKPQMFTNVEISINLGKKLSVPVDAVINTGVRSIVYVDKDGGIFEPREVTTGAQTEQLIEIVAGLKVGDKVASSANFLIDSEAKLKGIEPLPRRKPERKETPPTQSGSAVSSEHRH